jgi:hypothetical protein
MSIKYIVVLACLAVSICQPANVLVIESSACGRCEYLNSLLANLYKTPDFDKLVNWSIAQTAHLRETKTAENVFTYTHAFGDEFLLKAKVQHCANKLYANLVALKWAAYKSDYNNSKTPFLDLVKAFFKADSGAAVLACANGPKGNEYTREAIVAARKFAFGGQLPFIVVENKLITLKNNDIFDFKKIIRNICDLKPTNNELLPCKCNPAEAPEFLKYLDTEHYFPDNYSDESTEIDFTLQVQTNHVEKVKFIEEKKVEVVEKIVDFEQYWNSDD